MGTERYCEGNYKGAAEYLIKAAELGDAVAHYNLSVMYREGEGVQKDMKRETHHLEEAAIRGLPDARYNLGIEEVENGRFERARKHFIIAANLGHDDSLKELMKLYAIGHASKDNYADALGAYQAALDATKSVEREKVEIAAKNGQIRLT
jgi:TPR repeat protein